MLDVDAALDVFFQTCYEAGPDHCAFYDNSPAQISSNFDSFYKSLKTAPMPIFIKGTTYGLLDYSTARSYARAAMYTPYSTFPAFAEALALAQ